MSNFWRPHFGAATRTDGKKVKFCYSPLWLPGSSSPYRWVPFNRPLYHAWNSRITRPPWLCPKSLNDWLTNDLFPILLTPGWIPWLSKGNVMGDFHCSESVWTAFCSHKRQKRMTRALYNISAGQSPVNVAYASNYREKDHATWVKPIISTIVYKNGDIQKAFFLLVLLIIIGEFFAAPAITLADSAVLTLLGEDADTYSHQRMFGSFGWGLAMFFVG